MSPALSGWEPPVSSLYFRVLRGSGLLAALLAICVLSTGAQKSDPRNHAGQTDSVSNQFGTDDGPHVYWQDDETARVIYYCNGGVIDRVFEAPDTLRFFGFCHDTTTEYVMAANPPQPAPDQAVHVRRILAVSDIHGDYKSLVEILKAAGVVDTEVRWTWGKGHLVIVGDVFDRGPAVTECLWLIHRLETEAASHGGAIHYLLGNHELMALRGDQRYVHERYTQGIAAKSRFAYDDLFSAETELGRWLRSKHTLVRLNRTLFVHGGVTPELLLADGGFSGINRLVRMGLDYSSLRLNFDMPTKKLYGSLGPLWYRGYIQGIEGSYQPMNTIQVDSVLQLCDVDEVVVGHTEQDSLCLFHDGKVIAIDVNVEALAGQQALLWQDGQFYRVNNRGERRPIRGK